MTDAIALASSWTVAGILLLAAVRKTRHYLAFQGILSHYRLLPDALVPVSAPAIITTEVAAALALLKPADLMPGLSGALTGALLLSVYTGAIAINLIRGRTAIDCGCGGEPTPLSGWLLVRNGLLLGLVWMAGSAAAAQWTPGPVLLAAALTIFLWCAYAIGDQLLANRPSAPSN